MNIKILGCFHCIFAIYFKFFQYQQASLGIPLSNFAIFSVKGGGGLGIQAHRDLTRPLGLSTCISYTDPQSLFWYRGMICTMVASCFHPRIVCDRLDGEQCDPPLELSQAARSQGTLRTMDVLLRTWLLPHAICCHSLCPWYLSHLGGASVRVPHSTVNRKK